MSFCVKFEIEIVEFMVHLFCLHVRLNIVGREVYRLFSCGFSCYDIAHVYQFFVFIRDGNVESMMFSFICLCSTYV
jgi:hypothetical protein